MSEQSNYWGYTMTERNKTAFITGASGQDGSYLVELLLSKGYEVYGLVRNKSIPEQNHTRLDHIVGNRRFHIEFGDIQDAPCLGNIIKRIQPDEVYHLAAISYVPLSEKIPYVTDLINNRGTQNVIDAISRFSRKSKMFNASSSEIFGNNRDEDGYQRETTPIAPITPYGQSKAESFMRCQVARDVSKLFISSGILYNHTSSRHGNNFVPQKIVHGVNEIYSALRANANMEDYGLSTIKPMPLKLGDIDAKRDWGHSEDVVDAMWLILQQDKPDDYIVCTGKLHTVWDFCLRAFEYFGLDAYRYIEIDPSLVRKVEPNAPKGDNSKLKKDTGWFPEYNFEGLVKGMMAKELYIKLKEEKI